MNYTIQQTKQTIAQKTEELKNYFKTQNVIYQAKVGYFVHMTVNGANLNESIPFVNSLGLKISMVRANQNQKLSLFLETA